MHDLAFFNVQLSHLALERGRDLDRRLVGHDLAEGLVKLHRVARLHFPLHELAFVYAFAQFRKFELHLRSPRLSSCLPS